MRRGTTLLALGLLALGAGCEDTTTAADVVADTSGDADATPDVADGGGDADAGADTAPDVVDPDYADVPAASDQLQAGVADRSFRFPVGVPTVGYGPDTGPVTRFADIYPGTNAQHTDLGARALVLRSGGKSLVMVRLDLVGIWDTNRDEIGQMFRDVGRGDLADGLILSATHTHSSGGRLIDHEILQLAVDSFVPGMYGRVRQAIFDAVMEADANAVAAEVGHTTIQVDALHKDRRCENPPLQDDAMGLIKVVDAADGHLLALVVNYAMHGTVLSQSEHTLSDDAPGALEFGIQRRLTGADKTAKVLYVQSWAGDMAPVVPDGYITSGAHVRPKYDDLDAIGAAAADIVIPEIAGIATNATPEIDVLTLRFPLSGELANPDGAFDDYPWGGIYCVPSDSNCLEDGGTPYTELGCFPFTEEQTITSSQITAARIDDLGIVTLPGEPLTSIGQQLRDDALAATTGLSQVFVYGYSQGYLAYLLHPDDFWMGGYEGASALLGPGGAVYLVQMGTAIAERLTNPDSELPFEPVILDWGAVADLEPLKIEEALGEAAITEQPADDGAVRTVSWVGGDPAVDFFDVALEREDGGSWAPVLRANGTALTSDGPEIETSLEVAPRYIEQAFGPRTFTWTAKLPASFGVPLPGGPLTGTFRFVIRGERPDAYELTSEPFTL